MPSPPPSPPSFRAPLWRQRKKGAAGVDVREERELDAWCARPPKPTTPLFLCGHRAMIEAGRCENAAEASLYSSGAEEALLSLSLSLSLSLRATTLLHFVFSHFLFRQSALGCPCESTKEELSLEPAAIYSSLLEEFEIPF